jgi:2-methylisocitrate lyase-like PEP mutase family enzyme
MPRTPGDKRASLAAAIAGDRLVVAPGVFEMISAKLADQRNFEALYLTGYGIAASHLGVPDAGIASYADVLERARVIANGVDAPLICDADTGFGGLLNVRTTVQGFEAAGCAALQLEDQATPKRCGLTAGCRVIPADDMVRKLEVALEARADSSFLLIARTDAYGELGFEAALVRAVAYARAGADIIFVQGLRTEAELAQVAEQTAKPCIVNISNSDGLGSVRPERLHELGCAVAIFPGLAMLAAAAAMDSALATLHSDRSIENLATKLYARDAMHRLMGFESVWDFEKRWPERD